MSRWVGRGTWGVQRRGLNKGQGHEQGHEHFECECECECGPSESERQHPSGGAPLLPLPSSTLQSPQPYSPA